MVDRIQSVYFRPSRIAQLVTATRAYKVLEEVGAKPAITYLADLKNPVEGGHHAN